MQNVFCNDEQMRLGVMAFALEVLLFGKVKIITFEFMSNHVHMIMSGTSEDCMELFERLKRRLKGLFRSLGRVVVGIRSNLT